MIAATEKQLDGALHLALETSREFADWFLSRTKFAGSGAERVWSRCDHPWGRILYTGPNPLTGQTETSIKECETDILVVFKTPTDARFALHIENKLGSGKFTELQPELYSQRAAQWAGNPKYGNYHDFETVLVAPLAFLERNRTAVAHFDQYISHEDISAFIPLFGAWPGST
jgi:hypothetical protein